MSPVTRRFTCILAAAGLVAAIGCSSPKTLTTLPADELFKRGKEQFDRKKYTSAVESFQAIIYNFPGKSIVDTAQYYLALSYYSNKEYALAGVEFNRLLTNYPASVYAAQSQFMKAVCAFENAPSSSGLDQTELQDAIQQLEDFLIDRPESELIGDAKKYLLVARTRMARKYYRAGIVYTHVHAPKAAKIYFQKVIDDYTDTEFAPLAIFNLAEVEYEESNYDVARQKFDGFVTAFPSHELAPKAKEMAASSAFKAGEAAYDQKDYASAKAKLETFKKDFPGNKRIGKADKYLQIIAAIPVSEIKSVPKDTTNAKTGS